MMKLAENYLNSERKGWSQEKLAEINQCFIHLQMGVWTVLPEIENH